MTQKIDIYTVMGELDSLGKEETTNSLIKNRTEYCFEGNSIKLVNLAAQEDLLVKKSTVPVEKAYKQDLRKSLKVLNKMV